MSCTDPRRRIVAAYDAASAQTVVQDFTTPIVLKPLASGDAWCLDTDLRAFPGEVGHSYADGRRLRPVRDLHAADRAAPREGGGDASTRALIPAVDKQARPEGVRLLALNTRSPGGSTWLRTAVPTARSRYRFRTSSTSKIM